MVFYLLSRRTGILHTSGPASSWLKVIGAMAEAGMDAVRLSFSHGDHSSHRALIETVRRDDGSIESAGSEGMVNKGDTVTGLDEVGMMELRDLADGFGVGTAPSNSRLLDFAMDIVEVEGEPIARRGKASGAKTLLTCSKCYEDHVVPAGSRLRRRCRCKGRLESLAAEYAKGGKMVRRLDSPRYDKKMRDCRSRIVDAVGMPIKGG